MVEVKPLKILSDYDLKHELARSFFPPSFSPPPHFLRIFLPIPFLPLLSRLLLCHSPYLSIPFLLIPAYFRRSMQMN